MLFFLSYDLFDVSMYLVHKKLQKAVYTRFYSVSLEN